MNEIGIVIQARMGSSRLPGKVLRQFHDGENLLSLILSSIHKERLDIPIVVATSLNPVDNPIYDFCSKRNIFCFRGAENNVTSRFVECALRYNFDYIIRVCADNPFFDASSVEGLIESLEDDNQIDYVGYQINSTPAIKTHLGFWAELVSVEALNRTLRETNDIDVLQHVTNYIYSHSNIFTIKWKMVYSEIFQSLPMRLTVDTLDDFEFIDELRLKLSHRKKLNIQMLVDEITNNTDMLKRMKRNIRENAK